MERRDQKMDTDQIHVFQLVDMKEKLLRTRKTLRD